MSTEINGLSGYSHASVQKSLETATADRSKSAEDSSALSHQTAETITLTNTAEQLRETEASLASVSVVDNQKVEQIKQSIQDGSYQIDSERIADKLIALEQALNK